MRYSTPTTVTLVSILMQNLLLWSAVFVTGGMHAVPLAGILLFTLVGIFQLGVRLLAYTGVEKIGASRSGALQSVSPLISAAIAIMILGEPTIVVDCSRHGSGRGRHRIGLVEVGVAARELSPLASIVADRRRFSDRHEPSDSALRSDDGQRAAVFFGADGTVSLGGFLVYLAVSPRSQRLVWNRAALCPFSPPGSAKHFDLIDYNRHQHGPSRHRRAHRGQLSGLVADFARMFLRNVESINLESGRRNLQRRRR